MNELKVFKNNEFGEIGVMMIDGKEYFPAIQCAKVLGYTNPRKAIRDHCEEVTTRSLPTNGGIQDIKYIPEGDLYRLIIRSKLPTAKKFESWVFDEVLPEIRRTGGYRNINLEDIIIRAVTVAVSETVKAITPVLARPAPEVINDEYDSEPPFRRNHSIIAKLEPVLRTTVDDMILSRKYTYEEIRDFLAEQGISLSVSSVHRYKKALYRRG